MVQRPTDLRPLNVTVHRFDPAEGLASGTDFVLPVDSPNGEHAVSTAMSNAVAFTHKLDGGSVLPVACVVVTGR